MYMLESWEVEYLWTAMPLDTGVGFYYGIGHSFIIHTDARGTRSQGTLDDNGRGNNGKFWYGYQGIGTGADEFSLGLAIDLYNGGVYFLKNGTWNSDSADNTSPDLSSPDADGLYIVGNLGSDHIYTRTGAPFGFVSSKVIHHHENSTLSYWDRVFNNGQWSAWKFAM